MLHNSLKYRQIVSFKIETLEFLHVGETKAIGIESADLPIMKITENGKFKPIIPGSSIKGAIRNEYSRVLSSLSSQKLKELFNYTKLFTDENLKEETSEKIREIILNSIKNEGKVGLLDLLFGSEFFASPTIFTDAHIQNNLEEYVTERYHIRIDPDRDAVMKNALVEVEAAYPGLEFAFKIIYNSLDFGLGNVETPVDKAFNNLIEFLDGREMFLGGFKSRGYGLVRLKKENDLLLKVEDLIGGSK
ncbi:hypothetical protein DFR86_11400 [Acidianus sulfidivorans JP7]|nr:RAMP superfamily CRISPR-associated protein [Acidianus sulfidivorans]AWR98080.2 hypothetical protein DFR86_11400 [Acidianus sulfidivorans JP7]